MRVLFLNLASHDGLIACISDNHVEASKSVNHRLSDKDLVPTIESVLSDAGWNFTDLTGIACVTGPGGFTSLRVAVTLASVLADQLKIPVAGIHLSDLCAARVKEKMIWLHSTKKTALFARTFDPPWAEPTFVTLEDFNAQNSQLKTYSFVGELIPEHRAVIDELKITEATLKPMEEVLPTFVKALPFTKELPLLPWYGRGW